MVLTPDGAPGSEAAVSVEDIHGLFLEAIGGEERLSLLKGFRFGSHDNPESHKVFFSVGCDCGTSALISVEILRSKTLSQFKEALPDLVKHVRSRVAQFTAMTCDMHASMRTGGLGAGAA